MLIGTRGTQLRIPGTSCFLYNDVALALPLRTDFIGNASLDRIVPASFVGTLRFQSFFATPTSLLTSQGVQMPCR